MTTATTTPQPLATTTPTTNQLLQKPRWTTLSNSPSSEAASKSVSSASLLSVNKVSQSPIVIATSATSSPRPVVRVVTGATANRFHSGVSPTPIRISAPTPTPMTIQSSSNISLLQKSVVAPTRSPPAQLRGAENEKKDSGLESGEVSDASEGVQPDDGLYSKVPSYLTSVNVENSDSRTVAAVDEGDGSYDRIPAYVKGVAVNPAAAAATRLQNSVVTLGDDDSKSRSSSVSRSRSPPSRYRDESSSPVRHSSRLNDSKSPSRRLRHRRSSSSSPEPRKSSSASSRRRSLKKRSNRLRDRSRSRSFSPSPPRRSHFRSRSPRIGFSLEKQRMEQLQRQRREEKNRQVSCAAILRLRFCALLRCRVRSKLVE